MALAHAPRGIAVIITLTHTSGDHPTSPSDDSSRVPHGDNNVVTACHFDVKARVNLSRCGFSVSIVSRRGMASPRISRQGMDHQSLARSQNSALLAPYYRSLFTYHRSVQQQPCVGRCISLPTERFTAQIFGALRMNRTIAATLLFSTLGIGVVLAQTTTSPPSTTSPAVATNGADTKTAAPVAGANSFTMAQAQKRIEDQGYTQVTALAKDDKSIWRGHAMKNGKAVDVALDYQGNITAN